MGSNQDKDLVDLRITFRVKIKSWRIEDQAEISNRNWSLNVYDELQKTWINTIGGMTREGEEVFIEDLEILE